MIRPYVFVLSMLLVSRPPFSDWCDMCLSLVRHVSHLFQLGETCARLALSIANFAIGATNFSLAKLF